MPKEDAKENKKRRPPARTPEARENQLIAAAVDLAEKQIADGTASSQVITHFLKLGSTKEKMGLANQNKLLAAKIEQMDLRKDKRTYTRKLYLQ